MFEEEEEQQQPQPHGELGVTSNHKELRESRESGSIANAVEKQKLQAQRERMRCQQQEKEASMLAAVAKEKTVRASQEKLALTGLLTCHVVMAACWNF